MRPLLNKTLPVPVLIAVLFSFTMDCRHSSAANAAPHFPFAYVQEDCGPADGIVMVFYFTGKQSQGGKYKEPFLRIELGENLPKSAARSYTIKAGKPDVSGSRCLRAGSCETATSGFLTLSKLSRGVEASGEYELHFGDGSVEKGHFEAVWYRNFFLCG
jgi:hypothetical protein